MSQQSNIDDVVELLGHTKPVVRNLAVKLFRDITGSDDAIFYLSEQQHNWVLAVSTNLHSTEPLISVLTAETLVNLSQNPLLSKTMVDNGFVKVAMDLIYSKGSVQSDKNERDRLLVMLFVNLTQFEFGVNALLQIGDENFEGLYISKLVRSFCRSSDDDASALNDPFEHVGSVLVNITKTAGGRKIVSEPKRGILKQIIPQFDSASMLRKKGVLGTIRNCCFEAENCIGNLLSIAEFLWPVLLIPVAGKKAYSEDDISKMPLELGNALSHERESVDVPELRIEALDSIYLICLQEAGRNALWSVNGQEILKIGYEDEEDSDVMEAYERIGSLLVS